MEIIARAEKPVGEIITGIHDESSRKLDRLRNELMIEVLGVALQQARNGENNRVILISLVKRQLLVALGSHQARTSTIARVETNYPPTFVVPSFRELLVMIHD